MLLTMNECSCSLDFVMVEEWIAVFIKRQEVALLEQSARARTSCVAALHCKNWNN